MFKLVVFTALLALAAAKPKPNAFYYDTPLAYSSWESPAVAYSAPAVAYSAPAVHYSAPAVAYSAPALAYSSPAVAYASYAPYESYAYGEYPSAYSTYLLKKK
ncbi:hypothetical protein JYU34_003997 [Plutella xylostella]|uniref:Uncharacterized protein n=2 Tax=Plutella xylostella TaxID=51655 RepID=A0ABQ7QWW7_PLUXY|nr:cuticle protein 16.5 [Plutella xylostella]KAG7309544.1 hypothetical protein JYU34_003997 [Plutella xylostella]CAG9122767.1 unnamed protein product [Plutella xylostella]